MASAEQETAVLRMQPPRVSGAPEPSATTGTTIGSPIEALERDEILRTRTFSWLVMILAAVGIVGALLIPGGDPRGLAVMLTACSAGMVSMIYLLYQTRNPARFRHRRSYCHRYLSHCPESVYWDAAKRWAWESQESESYCRWGQESACEVRRV